MKSFGERIRELREVADLSLRELAKKLGGLSAAFLSDIELGRRHPSEKVLVDMARVLGTTVEELKRYDTRPPLDEIKRRTRANPALGLAFRRVLDSEVPPERLIRLAEETDRKRKQ
jgi:transcriptional regulator with XRE-family HTH domain